MGTKLLLNCFSLIVVLMFSAGLCRAGEMPETVTLDTMTNYFQGVEFDHTLHVDLGEDCSVCHHHTTGTGTADERCISCHGRDDEVASVNCHSCHAEDPFSAEAINRDSLELYQFHIDTPGLKAAYHWNCLGCHERMDGPTDCRQCHARTEEGDALYHADVSGVASGGAGGH